jgi:hypothetical protein
MEDKKVFITVDPKEGPPTKTDRYLTSYGFMNYSCEQNKWIPANSFGTKRAPSWYMKEISLTELMVGFAEWLKINEMDLNYHEKKTTKQLLDIYLKEKKI